ncbi:hypothetical protein [uncultured Ilyobacter sp.]|jgi:hypothetical protein|uniref:hypothetical protein n=1 Tax=uncultured Ilyobacter sp. TaxID=544433 RepID=UPI0029C0ABA7|nr:hypothetical protein [uncultured Ilyobacter sp.]
MEKAIEFIGKYGAVVLPISVFIIGIIIPKEKVFVFGKKAGKKLPKSASIKLAEYLDAFEQGLIKKEYNGDYSIVGNTQVAEAVDKMKIELGLEDLK